MIKTAVLKKDDADSIESLPQPNKMPTSEDMESIQLLTPKSNILQNLKFSFFATVIGVLVYGITLIAYPFISKQFLWLETPSLRIFGQSIFYTLVFFFVIFTSTSVRTWISSSKP